MLGLTPVLPVTPVLGHGLLSALGLSAPPQLHSQAQLGCLSTSSANTNGPDGWFTVMDSSFTAGLLQQEQLWTTATLGYSDVYKIKAVKLSKSLMLQASSGDPIDLSNEVLHYRSVVTYQMHTTW